MTVAEEGLRRGTSRMAELRQFVAKRAKSAGNRERYLALQFEQAKAVPGWRELDRDS
jgi:hypothetical protein